MESSPPHQVYQLDFGGRVTQESAKNFQIEYLGKQVLLSYNTRKNLIPQQNMKFIILVLVTHTTLQIGLISKEFNKKHQVLP